MNDQTGQIAEYDPPSTTQPSPKTRCDRFFFLFSQQFLLFVRQDIRHRTAKIAPAVQNPFLIFSEIEAIQLGVSSPE